MPIAKLIVSRGDLVNFTGLSLTSIGNLIGQGVFKARKDGRFDLQATVEKIIRYQGHRIANRTGASGNAPVLGLTEARVQHVAETTEHMRLKNMLTRGEIVPLALINDVVDHRDAVIKNGVLAYSSIAPTLVGCSVEEIEDKLIVKSKRF